VPLVVLVNPVPVRTIAVPTVIAGVYVVGAPAAVVTVMGNAPAVTPVVAAAVNVNVVPAAPFPALYVTSVGLVPRMEYELKPDPVRVSVTAAAPTVSGVVGLTEVMTGATVLAMPTPKAPARLKTFVLLPAPVPLVTVNPQASGVATDVTTIDAVPAVGLVMAEVASACVTVTPLTVSVAVFVISVKQAALSELVRDTVAPYSKPEPSNATGTVAAAEVAEGLTFSRPLPIVKSVPPVDATEPPSVLVTVMTNVPGVAAAPPDGFVGVTLKTIEVALIDVTDDVKPVPSTELANETVAPVAKPEPVIVTVVGAVASHTELGLTALIVGAASTVIAPASDALVPLASTSTTEQVPAVVPVDV
jgi:hypothetical protein